MSFCVLILGGSSAWSIDDWNSFFSINEIQPEEIIPNIFAWGSANSNNIPTWAPTPSITCHVYLTSMKDIHKLLKLNGKIYKDRVLYFEKYDPEKLNLTNQYPESSYSQIQTHQQSNQFQTFQSINSLNNNNNNNDHNSLDDNKSIDNIIQSVTYYLYTLYTSYIYNI